MSCFGQSVDNEGFNALVPIERFYPDLAPNTVSNATSESSSEPLFQGTRILYWYHPDYVSNVDLVTDVNGEAYELFLYNAWGESLHQWTSNSSNSWSSPYRFNSKELDPETGMHYYGARYHHPKLSVWMSVDPLASQNLNQYQFTGNNPLMYLDPDGRDTVFATLNDDLWTISSTSISEGSDYIALTVDGETEYHEFNEGEYGNRVNVLNIESTQDYTLAIYMVSGKVDQEGGVGFAIQPGGDPSTKLNSKKRLPDGEYSLINSPKKARWKMPWVTSKTNKEVKSRGIKFHPALSASADQWTDGCFVISSSYSLKNCMPKYNPTQSVNQADRFARLLGGFDFACNIKGRRRVGGRIRANFKKGEIAKMYLKSAW